MFSSSGRCSSSPQFKESGDDTCSYNMRSSSTKQIRLFDNQWLHHRADLSKKIHTDLLLLLGNNEEIHLHSAVIVPHSAMLSQLLGTRQLENKQTPIIYLPEVDKVTVSLMVDLLYSGRTGLCSLENISELNNLLYSLGLKQLLKSLKFSEAEIQPDRRRMDSKLFRQRSRVENVLNVLEVSEEEDDIVLVDKEKFILNVLEVSEEEYNDSLDILEVSEDEDISEASYSLTRYNLESEAGTVTQHERRDSKLSRQKSRVEKAFNVLEEEEDIDLGDKRKRKRKHQKGSPKHLCSRYVVHGHNNIMWAGETIESYEDVDVSWVSIKMEHDIGQFIDVSGGEKSFFCTWNKFLINYKPGVSLVHLKTALEEFVNQWGIEIMKSQLYTEFVTHLVWLEQSCLISEETLLTTVQRLQKVGNLSNVGS